MNEVPIIFCGPKTDSCACRGRVSAPDAVHGDNQCKSPQGLKDLARSMYQGKRT